MLVRVRQMWLNPESVVGIWVDEIKHSDQHYWRVTLRCAEGQTWTWRHEVTGLNPTGAEEDAYRQADEMAEEINAGPVRSRWPSEPAR